MGQAGRKAWADISSDSDSDMGDFFSSSVPAATSSSTSAATAPAAALPPTSSGWAANLASLSAQLRFLASSAPQSLSRVCEAATATDMQWEEQQESMSTSSSVSMELEEATCLVQKLKGQVQPAHQQAAAVTAELVALSAKVGEKRVAVKTLTDMLSQALADGDSMHLSADAVLQDLRRGEADARASLTSLQQQDLQCREARSDRIAALKEAVASEARRAAEKINELQQLQDTCRRTEELSTLQASLGQVQQHVGRHREEKAQLEKVLATLQAERAAMMTHGPGAKLEALEARASQLEKDCQQMMMDAEAEGSTRSLSETIAAEVAAAQQRNTSLAGQVREARKQRHDAEMEYFKVYPQVHRAKMKLQGALEEAQSFVAELQKSQERNLNLQAEGKKVNRHCSDLTREIAELEQRNRTLRSQCEEVEQQTSRRNDAKRKIEQAIPLKECKLQQLRTEKAASRVSLPPSSSHARPHILASNDLQHPKPGRGSKCGQSTGSDFGDAESTTAGESAAEGLP